MAMSESPVSNIRKAHLYICHSFLGCSILPCMFVNQDSSFAKANFILGISYNQVFTGCSFHSKFLLDKSSTGKTKNDLILPMTYI